MSLFLKRGRGFCLLERPPRPSPLLPTANGTNPKKHKLQAVRAAHRAYDNCRIDVSTIEGRANSSDMVSPPLRELLRTNMEESRKLDDAIIQIDAGCRAGNVNDCARAKAVMDNLLASIKEVKDVKDKIPPLL